MPENPDREVLHDKLKWLMLFRLIVAIILLFTGILIQFKEKGTVLNSVTTTIYTLAGLVFFLSILYLPLLKHVKKLGRLAYSQTLIDILIITFVIYISGGTTSPLSFLYILTIVSSAIVTYRRGGYWSASISSICYGLLVNLEYYHLMPSMAEVITGTSQEIPGSVLYTLTANISAFYFVAFLSGQLALQAQEAEDALLKKKIDFEALKSLNNDIVKNITSGLMTINNRGEITSFNSAAEIITGYRIDEIYGRKALEIFPYIKNKVINTNLTADKTRWESWFKRNDGKNYYLGFSMSPLKDSEGMQVGEIVIFQDLSSLKIMEDELKKTDRLAAVGKFAAGVAHEIRNPLASISGSIEILKSNLKEDYNAKLMNIVLREIDRLNVLITEFLNYAKPPQPDKKMINLNDIVNEVLEIFLNSKDNRNDIIIHTTLREMNLIPADKDQIKQVFWNLLKNATEAIEGIGKIDIETSMSVDNEKKVGELRVKDSGCGMSAENIKKIYDPFYTSREGGTGLGLSIAHNLVKAHGGSLTVESLPNKGSTFTLKIPENSPT
ncbi:MAG: PAS domain S-box protein [Proteobacteria bacterium]|nr:PAS domain S-box protein [Pseudomonadota bacterium]